MTVLHRSRVLMNKVLAPLGVEVRRTPRPDISFKEKASEGAQKQDYPIHVRPDTPRYINIGSGKFFHECWHNIDMPSEWYAKKGVGGGNWPIHIPFDLTSGEPLPIADGTVELAYTSHVVEHIPEPDVRHMLAEVHRCLMVGGLLRVTCPDMDLNYDALMRNDLEHWSWPSAYDLTTIEQRFLENLATELVVGYRDERTETLTDAEVREILQSMPKEAALDFIIAKTNPALQRENPGHHVGWFNTEKMLDFLKAAGFKEVWESAFGQSRSRILRNIQLFDTTHPEQSLYVEARK